MTTELTNAVWLMDVPDDLESFPPVLTVATVDVPDDLRLMVGEPVESNRHRLSTEVFLNILNQAWRARDDYFAGGEIFLFFPKPSNPTQRIVRGPDVFIVQRVARWSLRECWDVSVEGGRYPDLIIEFLSHSTEHIDLNEKKDIYERVFKTHEYFCYDPFTEQLSGWRLEDGHYVALELNADGRLWSAELGAWLGPGWAEFNGQRARFLRAFDEQGAPWPLRHEADAARIGSVEARAEDAEARMEDAEARAEDAEARAENARARVQEAEARAAAAEVRAEQERRAREVLEAELARLRGK